MSAPFDGNSKRAAPAFLSLTAVSVSETQPTEE